MRYTHYPVLDEEEDGRQSNIQVYQDVPEFKSKIRRLGETIFPKYSGCSVDKLHTRSDRLRHLPPYLRQYERTLGEMLAFLKKPKMVFITIKEQPVQEKSHFMESGVHFDGAWDRDIGYKFRLNGNSQSIIVSSTIRFARGWIGRFCGEPLAGGDCSRFRMLNRLPCPFFPGSVYILNELGLYETTPICKTGNMQYVHIHVEDCPFPFTD
jgi:hypothetical protein